MTTIMHNTINNNVFTNSTSTIMTDSISYLPIKSNFIVCTVGNVYYIHKLQSDTIIAMRIFILVGISPIELHYYCCMMTSWLFIMSWNSMKMITVLGFVTAYRIFQESLILEAVFNLKVNVVDTPLQVNHL